MYLPINHDENDSVLSRQATQQDRGNLKEVILPVIVSSWVPVEGSAPRPSISRLTLSRSVFGTGTDLSRPELHPSSTSLTLAGGTARRFHSRGVRTTHKNRELAKSSACPESIPTFLLYESIQAYHHADDASSS
jgi:hypothetical protein